MFNIGPLELIIVLVIALLVLGPQRLPDAARSVGRGIREFRGALSMDHDEEDYESVPPAEPVKTPDQAALPPPQMPATKPETPAAQPEPVGAKPQGHPTQVQAPPAPPPTV